MPANHGKHHHFHKNANVQVFAPKNLLPAGKVHERSQIQHTKRTGSAVKHLQRVKQHTGKRNRENNERKH